MESNLSENKKIEVLDKDDVTKKIEITPENIALTFTFDDTFLGYLIKIDGRPSYTDCEILKFSNPIKDLKSILDYEWLKSETKYNKKLNFMSVTYQSTKDNIKLMAVKSIDDDDDGGQILLLIRPNDFIIVSVIYGHPYIETPYFLYDNTDGSGPDMFNKTDMENPKILTQKLITYYNDFLADKYH